MITFLLFQTPKITFSIEECTGSVNDRINCYQNKVQQKKEQSATLNNEIQYMDNQIALTGLQIQQTEEKIIQVGNEINTLSGRIEGLDNSLDYLSKQLIERVVDGYKKQVNQSMVGLMLDSANAQNLFDRFKYVRTARDNNQRLLVQVQQAKLNFEDQKKLRETKKTQLDELTITLNSQKQSLDSQKIAKQTLLTATQNDERTYQSLLQKAKQELAGFSAFTQSAGGGLTSFGSGSNGWYYTQRDPAWGDLTLGNSPYPLWQAGCAVTSVAMACKKYGIDISPASIASDVSKFIYGDLLNNQFGCPGRSTIWLGAASKDTVKSYTDQGVPVIVRLVAPSVSGLHFVVLWQSDGDDFKMHDPYYGPDLNFSSRYDWSQITNAVAIQ